MGWCCALYIFVPQRGRSPLHWASGRGDTAVVAILLENGAGVNITNKVGITFILRILYHAKKEQPYTNNYPLMRTAVRPKRLAKKCLFPD